MSLETNASPRASTIALRNFESINIAKVTTTAKDRLNSRLRAIERASRANQWISGQVVELVHDELGSLGLFRELTDSRGRRRLVALQDSSLSPTRIDKVNGSAWLGKPGHEYKRSELPARQRTNTPANNSSHLKPVYKDIDKIRDEITATLNETALTIFLESLQLANDAK